MGFEILTYHAFSTIEFTNAERTRALVAVTIGSSGGTIVLEKERRMDDEGARESVDYVAGCALQPATCSSRRARRVLQRFHRGQVRAGAVADSRDAFRREH
jgi:hypothetical protein